MRTPLNGVIGMVDDLSSGPLNSEQSEKVSIMRDSSMMLLALINDILDFSKIDAGKIEIEKVDFDLHKSLDAIIKVTRESATRKGLRLDLNLATDCPRFVTGDVGRIRQILINLIGNAIKFTSTGQIEVSARLNNSMVQITVKDSGLGMSQDQLIRLFQPFTQADQTVTRKFGGTGLGLVISRELARLMGGDISVHSELGQGSTFTVTLNLPAAAPVKEIERAPFVPKDLSHLEVLVVEDNIVNQTVIRSFLKKFSITPIFADDGGSGLDTAMSKRFDLIFMDLQMPIMGGLEVTKRIRQSSGPNQHTRIIALTANASREDADACLNAGMNGFLSKPLVLADLARELEG
jgi:CheY-like chemotaxis protein/anti-sigma regulatory factor (Ser/Thr protein kinase)